MAQKLLADFSGLPCDDLAALFVRLVITDAADCDNAHRRLRHADVIRHLLDEGRATIDRLARTALSLTLPFDFSVPLVAGHKAQRFIGAELVIAVCLNSALIFLDRVADKIGGG